MTDDSASNEAVTYLDSLINKTLHLYTTDGRIFVGQMKCTDNERNIILALAQEYRQPTQADVNHAFATHGSVESGTKLNIAMKKRFVGLVVVPGKYIQKIDAEG